MAGFLERATELFTRNRLLKSGERIVVAVSGGVDSMVLLHILAALAPSFGWKMSVAHFNHQLRGRASDGDERFVRATARTLGVACDVGQANVRHRAANSGISIEMAARDLRHAFLARCARKRKARVVVLAQHADDQVELFLMRLIRGAGGAGLGGMRARSASPADLNVMLVRPLLDCFKPDLEEYARLNGIRFREDASNKSPEYDRNWVRLKVLPLLRKRHPAVGKTLLRSTRITQAESDFVREAANAWLASGASGGGSKRPAFASLHLAVQRRVLQTQLLRLRCDADFELVELMRLHPGKAASVAPGWEVVRDETGVVRMIASKAMDHVEARTVLELPGTIERPGRNASGSLEFGGLILNWRIRRRTARPAGWRAGREFFDADRVGAHLLLRHWLPGDRFQPIGLTSATKLQDWFVNRKIPARRRRQLVMAENEQGELFWVEGERIGDRCKITPATRRILELCWKRP